MGLSTTDTTEEKTSEKDVYKDATQNVDINKEKKNLIKTVRLLKQNNVSILLPFKFLDTKHMIYLSVELLISICSGFSFPIFNIFFGKTLKGIIEKEDISEYITVFVIVGVIHCCLSFLGGFLSNLVTQNILDNLKLQFLDAVFHFDGEFYDKYSGSKLKSDLEFYLSNIKAGVGIKFILSFTYLTNFFIIYIWGLTKSYRLVLCISLVFPFMFLVSKICRTYSLKYQLKSQIYNNNSLSIAEEAFVGIKTVVSYCGENFILKKFASSEKLYSKFTLKTNFFHSLNLGAVKLFTIGSYALGFWYGTKIIVEQFWNSVATQNADSFDGATVISVLNGVFISMYMLNLALPGFHDYLNAVNAAYQLFEIINYEPLVKNKETTGKILDSVKQIKFCNVKFQYSKRSDVDVFQSLDFELKEGKVYAFVGESGCGKSTILKLIERLYEPTEGEILINGKNNLKDLNLKWWRSQIGIVSQDPHLFSSSISTNLKYSLISKYELDALREGRVLDTYKKTEDETESIGDDKNTAMEIADDNANKNKFKYKNEKMEEKEKRQNLKIKKKKSVKLDFVSNAEVRSIGKKVYIHKFVNTLPDKYDTLIGATASSLSGGQKQRISIGRAIIRNPRILILDEATSSLDNKSEYMVQKTINKLPGNESRITIIVAHRLNTIQHADNIFVLSNKHKQGSINTGSYIAEQGTHADLMQKKDGLYYTMVKNQKVTDETDHSKRDLISRADTIGSSSVMYNSHDGSTTGRDGLRSGITAFSESQSKSICNKIFAHFRMNKFKSVFSCNKRYSYIYEQILQCKWQVAIALFFIVFTGVVYPFFGLIFAQYVKSLFQIEVAEENAKKYSMLILYISIGMGVGECFQQYFKCVVGENVESVTKHKFFENLLYQEISFFEEKKQSPGYLLSYINRDIHLLKIGFINNIGIIIQFVCLLLTSSILAIYFCPLVALIMTCVYLIFVRVLSKRNIFQQKKNGSSSEANSGMTHFHFMNNEDMEKDADFLIQEAFINIDVIISYGLERYYIHLISNSLKNSYKTYRKKLIVQSAVWGLSQSVQLFSNAFGYYLGSMLTRFYGVDTEDFLKSLFVFLFTGSYAGITMADRGNAVEALEAFDIYYPLMIRKSQIDSRDEGGIKIDKKDVLGKVEIKDVNFRYPNRPHVSVYDNLSFTCEEKKTTAIVGETGCGKSTIIGLFLKYYPLRDEHFMIENAGSMKSDEVNIIKNNNEESVETEYSSPYKLEKNASYTLCRNSGEILIDGINIDNYNLRDLRKLFSIVTQEPMIFNMSIYENITFGTEGATIEDVKRASKIAAIYDFIESLPEKYDTNVGPFGNNLSGGQKQRIALARALLKDPKILLLDEATSSLDSNSEKLIEEAFEKIKNARDKTIITIAHRISSIMKSDKIVVLNNPDNKGSYVQAQGTHNELMQIENCIYKKYVNLTM